jgi:putative endonuclease
MAAQKTWFVYLIECVRRQPLHGNHRRPGIRFKAHREGRGARYMRLHPPLRMLAAEAHPDRSSASKAEYRIKQLSAPEKRTYAETMTADPFASAP